MKKEEMDQTQRDNYEIFIKKIKEAGWDTTAWESLFDHQHCLTPEVHAEYTNTALWVQLGYYIEQQYLLLDCINRDKTSFRALLRLYHKDNLAHILDYIIGTQNQLSRDTFADFVGGAIVLGTIVALETPDGLVHIS